MFALWGNLRLFWKFALGFGVLVAMTVGVGWWAISDLHEIVGDAGEVIEGHAIRGEVVQREVDHLKWADQVHSLLTDDDVTTLDVQTDPHKCGFGLWYDGEGRRQAEETIRGADDYAITVLGQLEDQLIALQTTIRNGLEILQQDERRTRTGVAARTEAFGPELYADSSGEAEADS